MSVAERVAWGGRLQTMGTALFKAGRVRRAEAKYAAGAALFTVGRRIMKLVGSRV